MELSLLGMSVPWFIGIAILIIAFCCFAIVRLLGITWIFSHEFLLALIYKNVKAPF
jgi:hypothetical protein